MPAPGLDINGFANGQTVNARVTVMDGFLLNVSLSGASPLFAAMYNGTIGDWFGNNDPQYTLVVEDGSVTPAPAIEFDNGTIFTGFYAELADTPIIPTDVSDLTDTEGLLNDGGFSGDYNDLSNKPTIPADVSDLTDTEGLLGGGGGTADLSITVPGTIYKGFGARYGRVYANGSSSELTVSKIVIYKEEAVTASTIDPTSSDDNFEVTGLADSDVVALFVLYGDTNGEKSLDTLRTFARAAIDTVILDGGIEGSVNTITDMRSAFYENISTLAVAAGGLVTDFEFYRSDVSLGNGIVSGATTVRQGSGAVFEIADNGDGTYYNSGMLNGGTNYRAGHKILVLGTDLGGATPANDCIVTVVSVVDGEIFQWSVEGTAAGTGYALYTPVTGTNYQIGSGAVVGNLGRDGQTGNISYMNFNNSGSNYVIGDVLTLPGTAILGGQSPSNDITITVTGVFSGQINNYNLSGVVPELWPINSISDGGRDQYDTANYISTNLQAEINYGGGTVVLDGSAAFGAGSSYVALYDSSVFGFIATGSSANRIGTSGNSGADGSSTTDTGELLTTDQTYDPALTNLTLTNDPLQAIPVTFTKENYATANDVDVIEDDSTLQIGITRGEDQGIYNPFTEEGWDSNVSPQGTLWSVGYQGDLRNLESRGYTNFYAAYGGGNLGNVVPGSKAVMYVPSIEKYYLVEWHSWTQGQNNGGPGGGGFSYTRTEIDVTQVEQGIQFSDGTTLASAEGLGRVKSTATGGRRIEEVVGYKEVSVTERTVETLTTTASRSVTDSNQFWINSVATTIDDVLDNYNQYEVDEGSPIEFSLDNNTWYTYTSSYSSDGNERGYFTNNTSVTYSQGDTIYFRYTGGGSPQTWWSKGELPGGGTNFRGAVIDYHAWTGESTIIGSIHIIDDDGEEHISHQEVQSGSTDGENDDLWLVTTEGRIRYRRIDGESKTLKIHWTAKVFYGSEYYDD